MALDQATPGLGIEISADGLRRLARMLRPDAVEDPLLYSLDVDPTLRTLFGFSPELPPELPPSSAPHSRLGWLATAYAAIEEQGELAALKERLDRWVPEESEFTEYRPVMAQLLRLTTDHTLQDTSQDTLLEARYVPLYRNLIPATALQESCWRQFERDGEKVIPQTSSVGSIGLMQINRSIWRGFYDVERLKWNAAYNARAGAEILLRYLRQYGLAEEKRTGNLDNVARATYAVYNAGPKAVTRYRARNSSAREKKVDTRFWNLYRGFAANGAVDLFRCTVERGTEE
jgi:Transglycosylase SLT domain